MNTPALPSGSPPPDEHLGPVCDGEPLRLRIHGPPGLPTLVYLPGIHGDWTLVGGLRSRLLGRVRFAEFTYPRSQCWSLEEYARSIESTLADSGIDRGWVLAESFGSQVSWPLCAGSSRFQPEGLILAGGFGAYPMRRLARVGAWIAPRLPLKWFNDPLRVYAAVARWRFRSSPTVLADIETFIARRTDADRHAAAHRLRLIVENRPEELARRLAVPVYYVTGLFDPVVPWPMVPRWLRRHCPRFREWQIIRAADHNVLGTGRDAAAEVILRWMSLPAAHSAG